MARCCWRSLWRSNGGGAWQPRRTHGDLVLPRTREPRSAASRQHRRTPPRPLRCSTAPFPSLMLGGLALAATAAHAQSTVTVYGRLNVSLEHADASHAPRDRAINRESNNRSVIGFRGVEDLGDGVHGAVPDRGLAALDTGVGPSLANRDTRVGLQTLYGLLFAGHWGTPYLLSTSTLDPWHPTTAGYMALMANGSAPTTNHLGNTASFDRRQQNIVQYWTPAWNGLTGRVAYAFNDGEVGPNGARPQLLSASITWDDGPGTSRSPTEQHRDYQGPHLTDSATKLGAAYRFGPGRLAAAVERLRYETPLGALTPTAPSSPPPGRSARPTCAPASPMPARARAPPARASASSRRARTPARGNGRSARTTRCPSAPASTLTSRASTTRRAPPTTSRSTRWRRRRESSPCSRWGCGTRSIFRRQPSRRQPPQGDPPWVNASPSRRPPARSAPTSPDRRRLPRRPSR